MKRPTRSLLYLFLTAVAACSIDVNQPARPRAPNPGGALKVTTLLDEISATTAAIFPNGLVTASGDRWDGVRNQLAGGHPDVAKSMLVNLAKWIVQKIPQMNTPPGGETKEHAAARLILAMSRYVYSGGVNGPVTDVTAGEQATSGVIDPNTSLTLTTSHADNTLGDGAVQLDAGSVAQTTIVVLTEVTGPWTANCSGPLVTKYCQQPKFFQLELFPHTTLLTPGKFEICHVDQGTTRLPVGNHDNLRVAHEKPANLNFITGGAVVDNIEILPWDPTIHLLASVGSPCYTTYATQTAPPPGLFDRALGRNSALARLAHAVAGAIAPRTAYASRKIDLGGGGRFIEESIFGLVDTTGLPDLAVQSFTTTPLAAAAGGTVTVPAFDVANVGTATSPGDTVQLYLSTDATITTADTPLGSYMPGAAIVPGGTAPISATPVTIPGLTIPGSYYIGPLVSMNTGGLSESSLANNAASVAITVVSGSGSPTIDGTFSPGEWNAAVTFNFLANKPGGGTTPATLYVMNDATNIYFAVKYARTVVDGGTNLLNFEFDANNNNVGPEDGDDYITYQFTPINVFSDAVRGCSALCVITDAANGAGAFSNDGSFSYFEMRHPLNSGEPGGVDIALTIGQTTGIKMVLQIGSVSTTFPGAGYQSITINP